MKYKGENERQKREPKTEATMKDIREKERQKIQKIKKMDY